MKRRKDEVFTSYFGDTVPLKSHRATRRAVNLARKKRKEKSQ